MARRQAKSNNSLWFTTGILLLIFIVILFYLDHKSSRPTISAPVVKKSAHTQLTTKPKFDFYNVLQQPSTHSSTEKSTAPSIAASNNLNKIALHTQPTTIPTPAAKYLLRVASLKNFADADSIKAELTLLGYNVSIQKVSINNTLWYRVNLGPYNSLNAVQKAQNDLKKNHYSSVILKLKRN